MYENNVQSITNVRTHWNKKILDPKIDPHYQHHTLDIPNMKPGMSITDELDATINAVMYNQNKGSDLFKGRH